MDTREKQPIPLPGHVHTVALGRSVRSPAFLPIRIRHVTLPVGDYAYESPDQSLSDGRQYVVLVERKASWSELEQNLVSSMGRDRFLRNLDQMTRVSLRPILLLEDPGLNRIWPLSESQVDRIRTLLVDACMTRGISFHWAQTGTASARRAMGSWLASLLAWGHSYIQSRRKETIS